MRYDFLKNFPKRMKNVGLYATLVQNIVNKTSWSKYGFDKADEQINLVFSVLLFVMEKSLKDEYCTIDDVKYFIDDINSDHFQKPLSIDECGELTDFIINVILSNDGKAMTFDGYDYEQRAYHIINVRYVTGRAVYIDGDVRRTSYSLTDAGYNLLLSTLEVESNLRFTIQEMIFKLHLEKQSYDRAAEDIRELFNQIRIQLKKIETAMNNIRRNALDYSVAIYQEIINENLDMVHNTKDKFESYKDNVEARRREFEDINYNSRELTKEDKEKIANLKIISEYLGRSIEEHQKILLEHFNLKDMYTKELENLSAVSSIKRFSLKNELYDKVLLNPEALDDLNIFLVPLFNNDVEKIYDPIISTSLQKTSRRKKEDLLVETLDFDENEWKQEQERLRQEKIGRYKKCLSYIITEAMKKGSITLKELRDKNEYDSLIPSIDTFKEVMIELIKTRKIDVIALKKERSMSIDDGTEGFELFRLLLDILEDMKLEKRVGHIIVAKYENDMIEFLNISDDQGKVKTIRCSNVKINIYGEGDQGGSSYGI